MAGDFVDPTSLALGTSIRPIHRPAFDIILAMCESFLCTFIMCESRSFYVSVPILALLTFGAQKVTSLAAHYATV